MAVSTKFGGDASELLAEQKKVAEGAEDIKEEYRKLSRETREAANVAQSALRRAENAQDKYERQVNQARVALQRGKITLDQYNRSVNQLAIEYRDAEDAQRKALGPDLDESISSAIAGMVSLQTAVQLVSSAFEEAKAQAEELAEINRESTPGFGELVQVSRSDEDFNQLVRDAQQIFAQGGAATLDEASALRFSLRSAGRDEDVDTFTRIGQVGLSRDIPELVKSIQQLSTAFGTAETGDTQSIISKGLAASAEAQTTLNELLSASARSASAGSRLGFSDESVLAATTAIADPLGPDVAATRLQRFFLSLDKEGIEAESIPDALQKIRSRIDDGEKIFDVLGGRQEAAQAFDLLEKNAEKFARTFDAITRANDGRDFTDRIGRGLGNQTIASTLEERQAQAGRLITQEGFGQQAQLRNAQIQRIDQFLTLTGRPDFLRAIDRTVLRGASRLDIEPGTLVQENFLRGELSQAPQANQERANELLEQILAANQRLIEIDQSNARGNVTVPQPEPGE